MAKKLKEWFDEELAKLLANKIADLTSHFDIEAFVKDVSGGLAELELKDRIELFADQLDRHVPGSYREKTEVLVRAIGPENPNETGMFTEGYWIMPIAKFVEKYGLDDFSTSINAIEEITKRNTGEYAIRPFLRKYTARTLGRMKRWSKSNNFHLRRLASEGVRIKLPWAEKMEIFVDDPTPIIDIIGNLKDDNSKFVQKSVANNLNDMLKVNRKFGESVINEWAVDPTENRKWIINHALRNLKKKQDNWALSIIGQL